MKPDQVGTAADSSSDQPPGLLAKAWNLTAALAAFVADGCQSVAKEAYEQRLRICDGCDRRSDESCDVCGCRIVLKAKGRAFECPLGKWPNSNN